MMETRKCLGLVILILKRMVHLQQLKGMQCSKNKVCERGRSIFQTKVYKRGIFSVKNGISKGKGLDLG